jgi:hypothetical protein
MARKRRDYKVLKGHAGKLVMSAETHDNYLGQSVTVWLGWRINGVRVALATVNVALPKGVKVPRLYFDKSSKKFLKQAMAVQGAQ